MKLDFYENQIGQFADMLAVEPRVPYSRERLATGYRKLQQLYPVLSSTLRDGSTWQCDNFEAVEYPCEKLTSFSTECLYLFVETNQMSEIYYAVHDNEQFIGLALNHSIFDLFSHYDLMNELFALIEGKEVSRLEHAALEDIIVQEELQLSDYCEENKFSYSDEHSKYYVDTLYFNEKTKQRILHYCHEKRIKPAALFLAIDFLARKDFFTYTECGKLIIHSPIQRRKYFSSNEHVYGMLAEAMFLSSQGTGLLEIAQDLTDEIVEYQNMTPTEINNYRLSTFIEHQDDPQNFTFFSGYSNREVEIGCNNVIFVGLPINKKFSRTSDIRNQIISLNNGIQCCLEVSDGIDKELIREYKCKYVELVSAVAAPQ